MERRACRSSVRRRVHGRVCVGARPTNWRDGMRCSTPKRLRGSFGSVRRTLPLQGRCRIPRARFRVPHTRMVGTAVLPCPRPSHCFGPASPRRRPCDGSAQAVLCVGAAGGRASRPCSSSRPGRFSSSTTGKALSGKARPSPRAVDLTLRRSSLRTCVASCVSRHMYARDRFVLERTITDRTCGAGCALFSAVASRRGPIHSRVRAWRWVHAVHACSSVRCRLLHRGLSHTGTKRRPVLYYTFAKDWCRVPSRWPRLPLMT
jgi:hypothetical protein